MLNHITAELSSTARSAGTLLPYYLKEDHEWGLDLQELHDQTKKVSASHLEFLPYASGLDSMQEGHAIRGLLMLRHVEWGQC